MPPADTCANIGMIGFNPFLTFLNNFLFFACVWTCSIQEAISDPVRAMFVGLNFVGIVLQLGSSGTSWALDVS